MAAGLSKYPGLGASLSGSCRNPSDQPVLSQALQDLSGLGKSHSEEAKKERRFGETEAPLCRTGAVDPVKPSSQENKRSCFPTHFISSETLLGRATKELLEIQLGHLCSCTRQMFTMGHALVKIFDFNTENLIDLLGGARPLKKSKPSNCDKE